MLVICRSFVPAAGRSARPSMLTRTRPLSEDLERRVIWVLAPRGNGSANWMSTVRRSPREQPAIRLTVHKGLSPAAGVSCARVVHAPGRPVIAGIPGKPGWEGDARGL